ncbi:hypothetical protein Q4566_09625 [Tamlana sp. 2_MG-2023]|uniref:tetratricopeptide repeat protein n=1 Tax=unclassified Tamlana TaxID=2614803 RepID=UPI0026E1D8BA|nr:MULTISPECIES: hypothetical protein [unclassified Tamlana]MDO6760455.1 hypothetical protein [Tamlana sp. 2_MG-2023]MDO6790711.1 hypothetical protein [Tamlana sp. 1_MG-2023]
MLKIKFILIIGFLVSFYNAYSSTKDSTRVYIDLYHTAINSDSLQVTELLECRQYFEHKKDSIWLIRSLIGLSKNYSRLGNYNDSFRYLWKALHYAEPYNNDKLLFQVHDQLATMFYIFDKNEETLLHRTQALNYAKKSVAQSFMNNEAVISAYYGFVHYYRKVGEYERSLKYLDSCQIIADKLNYSPDQRAFLYSEKGNILRKTGQLEDALVILQQAEKNFKRIEPSYLPIIYFYLGSTYMAQEDWIHAESYFKKTVSSINNYKTHYDAKSESLSRLAFCLHKQKRYMEAYVVLRESKEIYDNTFSTKSYQNAGLLGIRNMYKEELEERDKIILERDKELIQQKAQILTIRLVFLGLFSVIIVGVLFWYVKLQRKKFKTEKEKQQLKTQMEQEQNRALVEIKNKEITSFTLRLIDKQSIISEMVESINNYAPTNIDLLKSIKHKTTGRIKLWEEFDKRFIDVNKGFYKNLKANYPDLTPTELKHCALIKLNFSAKEMAQLLNISVNGVNTSRYRIRKKLNLKREDNLTTVIEQF